jgi:hypothetical protein
LLDLGLPVGILLPSIFGLTALLVIQRIRQAPLSAAALVRPVESPLSAWRQTVLAFVLAQATLGLIDNFLLSISFGLLGPICSLATAIAAWRLLFCQQTGAWWRSLGMLVAMLNTANVAAKGWSLFALFVLDFPGDPTSQVASLFVPFDIAAQIAAIWVGIALTRNLSLGTGAARATRDSRIAVMLAALVLATSLNRAALILVPNVPDPGPVGSTVAVSLLALIVAYLALVQLMQVLLESGLRPQGPADYRMEYPWRWWMIAGLVLAGLASAVLSREIMLLLLAFMYSGMRS